MYNRPIPKWLEQKLQQSTYERVARRYYDKRHPTNSLYIEVTGGGKILFYDGWSYKRGIEMGDNSLKKAEFAVIPAQGKGRIELASLLCFTRRARKWYNWNIIPVWEGFELDPDTFDISEML